MFTDIKAVIFVINNHMKTNSENLITDLIGRTRQHMNQAENFRTHSDEELNYKNSTESWSVLECLEHLNLYGDYYLPEIQQRLRNNTTTPTKDFRPGIIGGYFAKMMLPSRKMSKIKTFKDKNPNGSKLDRKTLDRFINQQKKMLELLERSRKVDLNKNKTSVSIAGFIKLKLGDTLKVVIYHNYRHLVQAEKALEVQRVQGFKLKV